MHEIRGDLFSIPCDALCITTNGFVTEKGKGVMGRGCAKQIRDKHPEIEITLGEKIKKRGNQVNVLMKDFNGKCVLSFPVKPASVISNGNNIVRHAKARFPLGSEVPGYLAKATEQIIVESAKQLRKIADAGPWKKILVPRPGCGAGELDWPEIRRLIAPYLDERFYIVSFPLPSDAQYFAGIGARKTPKSALDSLRIISHTLTSRGYVLRTGGATGCDQSFYEHAYESELYLPWPGYNKHHSEHSGPSEEAMELASEYHGGWDGLADSIKRLHGRNAEIILGKNLDHPVKFVYCWSPNGKDVGGTGVAIRIAKAHGIPVFNLGDESQGTFGDYIRGVNQHLKTEAVNLYHGTYDTYVGRGNRKTGMEESIWHNPFRVSEEIPQGEAVKLYEPYIRAKLADGSIPVEQLKRLKGKRLGCYCKPKPCHADVLVKLVQEYFP